MAWFTFNDSHPFFANTKRTFVSKILRSIAFETGYLYSYVLIKFEDYSMSVVYTELQAAILFVQGFAQH